MHRAVRTRLWQNRFHSLRYYSDFRFALIELFYGWIALFSNPYRTCRKFLQKKGRANIHAYGETPFATYQRIVEQCGIGPEDTWLELGSGRGKGCFWLARFVRCKVIGIEWIPQFVWVANLLKSLFRIKNVDFQCQDIAQVNLQTATVIYLYGDAPIEIPCGVRVITTGEPLPGCQILKSFWVRYPWGRTTAYLQRK